MGEDGYLNRLSDSTNLVDFEQKGIGSLLCNPLLDALWVCAKHVVPHYLQCTQVLCQGGDIWQPENAKQADPLQKHVGLVEYCADARGRQATQNIAAQLQKRLVSLRLVAG